MYAEPRLFLDHSESYIEDDVNSEAYKSPFRKTSFCKSYPYGMCWRGDNCNFAHTKDEIVEKPNFSKTILCKSVKFGSTCFKGNSCTFAHSIAELNPESPRSVRSLAASLSLKTVQIFEHHDSDDDEPLQRSKSSPAQITLQKSVSLASIRESEKMEESAASDTDSLDGDCSTRAGSFYAGPKHSIPLDMDTEILEENRKQNVLGDPVTPVNNFECDGFEMSGMSPKSKAEQEIDLRNKLCELRVGSSITFRTLDEPQDLFSDLATVVRV